MKWSVTVAISEPAEADHAVLFDKVAPLDEYLSPHAIVSASVGEPNMEVTLTVSADDEQMAARLGSGNVRLWLGAKVVRVEVAPSD